MAEYAAGRFSIREVTVNGLNPQAAGFYRHTGFETYKRTALNESCDPYPLLYMRLK
ncbi:MAG: GNAT family N-acetyltransferase [Oscillospiraceae bacterium]|nr:GNAT family N-acetyltransferase [Oscillospiraceae bacterium]